MLKDMVRPMQRNIHNSTQKWRPLLSPDLPIPDISNIQFYLPFDEGTGTTITEGSGFGRATTLVGTSHSWVPGKVGSYAFSFNGSDTRITSNFNPNYTNKSVSTWLFWRNAVNRRVICASNNGAGATGQQGFIIYSCLDGSNAIIVDIGDGTGARIRLTGPTMTESTWYHVVLVHNGDGSLVTLYLNNVSVASSAITGFTNYTAQSFRVGMYSHTTSTTSIGYLLGYLDDFLVFDKALNLEEIAILYNRRNI